MNNLTPEERQRIYEEASARLRIEQGRHPDATDSPEPQRKPNTRRIVISAISTFIVVVLGSGIAHHEYRLYGLKQKLGEAIGMDLGLTETILRVESDASKITFVEFFELCNKSVENRTALLVELRGLYPDIDSRLKTHLVAYLNAENEFIRAKREFYRKVMEQSSASKLFIDGSRDYPTSAYGWEYYRDRVTKLKAKLVDATRESERSAGEFADAYERMTKEETAIADEVRSAGLRFDPVFQKHAQWNLNNAQQTKESAQKMMAVFSEKPQ